MIKTFKDLREVDFIYGKLLEEKGFELTKLAYAFKRFGDLNSKKLFAEFNEELNDTRIDLALEDPTTKAVLYSADHKSYQYSKESLKKLPKSLKAIEDKWDAKEIEVTSFFCKELGDIVFTQAEEETLKGCIIE
tara:strand:+ start:227 stop:628 length:402 start_codon:yes stop_codon:yes gene_type:complete